MSKPPDLADKMQEVLTHLKQLSPCRAVTLAIERLEECAFWASCAVAHVKSPIDWAQRTDVSAPKPAEKTKS